VPVLELVPVLEREPGLVLALVQRRPLPDCLPVQQLILMRILIFFSIHPPFRNIAVQLGAL
jgi:hypothetical protein